MKIKAIQKLTLIDYPGKLACTIFIFGCNFRCGFCHNPELVLKEEGRDYSQDEILDFLKKRKNYLDGVCFTGGEPLLSLEKKFLEEIKKLGYLIKVDTNGTFPEKLKEFINAGLIDFVSMDIKSSKEKYPEVVNAEIEIEKIEKSIKIISELSDYEFRTTILEKYHDEQEIKKMMEWLREITQKKLKKFALQGFTNSGKFIDENFKTQKEPNEDYLKNLKAVVDEYFEQVVIRI